MSTKLYYVPLEKLAERYTEQWYNGFTKGFKREGFDVHIIYGPMPLTDTVDVGTFLDINSTVAFKAGQMQVIAKLFHEKKIEPYSKFFFADVEFWGIEAVRLLSQMNNVPIEIYGFLHAASFTNEDAFAVAKDYQKHTEIGWIAALDAVFVGSHYQKRCVHERRLIPARRGDLLDRIHVTPNPLFVDEYKFTSKPKQNKLILPNRFDYEKRPNISLDLALIIKSRHPDWEIVVTTGRKQLKSNRPWLVEHARILETVGVITIKDGLTKDQYHEELETSKVMLTCSIEESYGYCIAEALYYDTRPVMPRGLSHDEFPTASRRSLYDSEDEALSIIEEAMTSSQVDLRYGILTHCKDSIPKMCRVMRGH